MIEDCFSFRSGSGSLVVSFSSRSDVVWFDNGLLTGWYLCPVHDCQCYSVLKSGCAREGRELLVLANGFTAVAIIGVSGQIFSPCLA